MVANLVYALVSIVIGLLGVRIVLTVLGIDHESSFGIIVYSSSEPLVWPFFGLFGTTIGYGSAHLEVETIVALMSYLLLGWVIIQFITMDNQ